MFRPRFFYDVDCHRSCEGEHGKCVPKACRSSVVFIRRKDGLNITHVIVKNLFPFVNYTMKIYAKNRVSELAKRRHGIEANLGEITVRTNGSYQSVSGLNKISLKFLFICLSFVHCAHVASDGATSPSDAFQILLAKIMENQYESKKGSERAVTIVLNFLRCLSSQLKFLTDLDKTKQLYLMLFVKRKIWTNHVQTL